MQYDVIYVVRPACKYANLNHCMLCTQVHVDTYVVHKIHTGVLENGVAGMWFILTKEYDLADDMQLHA